MDLMNGKLIPNLKQILNLIYLHHLMFKLLRKMPSNLRNLSSIQGRFLKDNLKAQSTSLPIHVDIRSEVAHITKTHKNKT